jgi:nucleotide sugar dehydrogenase
MVTSMSREEIKEKLRNGEITIAVYGLGKMGLPLAAVFAEHGAKVIGVDINEKVVENINRGINHIKEEPGLDELVKKNVKERRLMATTNGIKASKESDIKIILVPTLADNRGNLKLDVVYDVCEKIASGLKKGDVVITEATMPPGTTENLIPILEKSGLKLGEFGLAHCPERTMTGTAIRDITGEYPKIVGANNKDTLEVVIGLYETINKKGVIPMSPIKAAEAVKVFEGVYRDVNIGLANELSLWCEEHKLDILEIIRAANTQPYCSIHLPGAGVGGHCIPIYPWFVTNTTKNVNLRIIKTARELNDYMPRHVVELTIKGLNKIGKAIKNSNVLILGLTFRGGVKEFTKSPALDIIKNLKEWEANIFVYDPLCNEEDIKNLNVKWKDDFRNIDVIIIATDHKEFKDLDLNNVLKEIENKVIIDGKNVLDPKKVKNMGFIYFGVGRT